MLFTAKHAKKDRCALCAFSVISAIKSHLVQVVVRLEEQSAKHEEQTTPLSYITDVLAPVTAGV